MLKRKQIHITFNVSVNVHLYSTAFTAYFEKDILVALSRNGEREREERQRERESEREVRNLKQKRDGPLTSA